MAQNGKNGKKWQKWPKMAKNGQKWPKMAKNGQKWQKWYLSVAPFNLTTFFAIFGGNFNKTFSPLKISWSVCRSYVSHLGSYRKHKGRLKMFSADKRSSLFIVDEKKSFVALT